MTEPLVEALGRLRDLVLDPDHLVRAVVSGRQKGRQPSWRRVELRWVDLRAGRHLKVTALDEAQAHTSNHAAGVDAATAVDALTLEPFGNWHVETTTETVQLRVTKRLEAQVHREVREGADTQDQSQGHGHGHDRVKDRLLAEDDPVFRAVGLADADGRLKPSRQAKYRQVEEFLRLLDSSLSEARAGGRLRRPSAADPLRIADLGCGNAYLTFAAQRFLSTVRDLPVVVTGVDVREQSREHNTRIAAELGVEARFVAGTIGEVVLDPPPEVVLALHACDTATDDALAQAVRWQAPLILAAPCCHHDIASQLKRHPAPAPYAALTRHGILRERFADTLTDGLRASLLRAEGYRVDVVQFVESRHTPRNTMLRAVRTGVGTDDAAQRAEYDDLVAAWGLRPRLGELLGSEPAP